MSSTSESSSDDDRDRRGFLDNDGSGSDQSGRIPNPDSDGLSDLDDVTGDHDDRDRDLNDNDGRDVDLSKLHLCPLHEAGSMTRDCGKCSAALAIIPDPNIIQKLTTGAGTSGLLSRYAGRCDQVKPTIELSDNVIELAHKMITQGQFRAKNAWPDVVKDYLTLPAAQHERLSQDIVLEGVFSKFRNDKRYKTLFKYHREARDALKNLRLSQRPVLSIIEKVNNVLLVTRQLGEAAGLTFPADPPVRAGVFVPRDTRTVHNNLQIGGTDHVFPPPSIEDLAQKHNLDDNAKADIDKLFDDYRDDVAKHYTDLFKSLGNSLNDVDDLLIFYSDLYSHVDSSFRDLLRDRMASIFKSHVKTEVLDRSKHKKLKGDVKGLYGGDAGIRSNIKAATKEDAYLNKAVERKNYKPRSTGSSSYRRRSRSRSRDRRDSQSVAGNSRQPHPRSGTSGGGGGGRSSAPKRKYNSKGGGSGAKKGKYDKDKKGNPSPTTFPTIWSSFISPMVIMMVTSLGLTVSDLPSLDLRPIGGRIRYYLDNWKIVCSNKWVLSVIKDGYKIPVKTPPRQSRVPSNPPAFGSAHDVLVKEALDLKLKSAVIPVHSCAGQYISTYFAVPKPRKVDAWRPILNLKYFNRNVTKYKFSMETLSKVREWIQPGAFCVGLDIKDAFLHIPMHSESKKFLRFNWLGELLEWQVLVFGLTCSPRVITKVIKPILAFLRNTWKILISIYIDDILIQSSSPTKCNLHCQLVITLFMALGWSFKWEKCSLVPSQTFTHLGFDFNTKDMIISVPLDKITKIQEKCTNVLNLGHASVLTLEKLVGTMESLKPATPLATLHFRSLQSQLLNAKSGVRNPDQLVTLTQESRTDLSWWTSPDGFAANSSAPIREPEPSLQIYSDANLSGGGSHSSRGEFQQRKWSEEELQSQPHINLLEIRAAKESLTLARPGDRVRINIDSRTAAAYIRKQGGTLSPELSAEACDLWRIAIARNITILSPVWLSSKDNAMADLLSRQSLRQWECQLSRPMFLTILATFQVTPTLDCFASRNTRMLPRYMTWFPDQEAVARDAMIHQWDPVSYLFPPVPLVMKTLQKVKQDQIQAVLIVPEWPSALWWPILQGMMVEPLMRLPHYREVISMVDRNLELPYLNPLIAALIQG